MILSAVAVLGITCRNESRLPFLFLCGLVFLAVSAICGISGVMALGRNLTPFPTPSDKTEFVQRGIYGFIRHPLYTAVMFAALGWSLIRTSWPALAASLALAVFLNSKVRNEEHWLRQRFPDYARYERHVRRFIPWIY
jgi:protein-S-isoprenylcysteine O-methyltransferase Ste14